MRVVSGNAESPVATVGVYVDAGSRYEDDSTSGWRGIVKHQLTRFVCLPGSFLLLQHMATKSTQTRTDFRVSRDYQKAGFSSTRHATP